VTHITDPARSALMKSVKQRNTVPEVLVRRILFSLGLRFRLHRADLPGSPDIVLSTKNAVIFVHGCFWHRHPSCKLASNPKSNLVFWEDKFEKNIARDRKKAAQLRRLGWRVLTVWECETRRPEKLKRRLAKFFCASLEHV
jgi:DNA mismatch endonuclease (patch repair protein)